MQGTNILVRRRLVLVFFIAALIFIALIGRLFWLQLFKSDELKDKASEVRMRNVPVEAQRGTVFDRNGDELVTSISVDSIYAIPHKIENPRKVAQDLSTILEIDESTIYKRLTKNSAFEWIQRKVDIDVSQEIKNLEHSGIEAIEENERYYLNDSLASHLLGFTGIDNQGLLGLEKSYNDVLQGKSGRIVVEHDAVGREIPQARHDYQKPVPGDNLVLTLDRTIQYFVERELDNVVDTYDPKLAVGLVMDPKTGEILAMGNRPSFNPNNWKEVPKEVWDRNPAIWYTYEPGSTFKIVTGSSALEVGAVKPNDEFHDPGYIRILGHRIRCWKAGGHGTQTFEEVVQNSCNPGFVEVGLNLGKEQFYKYIRAFGFGKKTGINLPGEEQGIMIPEENATDLNIATMAIGQSIAVTPIQLISAVSAVANGGELMEPRLVREISDEDGNVVEDIEPKAVREVITNDTSRELNDLLEKVVSDGTGRNAFVEGYRVAGKTGTAQVVGNQGYVQGKYVSSFAGFAPAEDPQVAILVMIAEPKGGAYTGGQVAAPVFHDIAKDVLRYMDIPQTPGLEKPAQPWEEQTPKEEVEVPNVVNFPVEEARNLLRSKGLNVQISGEDSVIYDQNPEAGASVEQGTAVVLDANPAGREENGEEVTMPDLNGLSIRETANVLEGVGLYLAPEGSGIAVEQSEEPGEKVSRGTTITVKFRPPGEENVNQEEMET